ncbi:unnamed protein product [Victoria cruziana]
MRWKSVKDGSFLHLLGGDAIKKKGWTCTVFHCCYFLPKFQYLHPSSDRSLVVDLSVAFSGFRKRPERHYSRSHQMPINNGGVGDLQPAVAQFLTPQSPHCSPEERSQRFASLRRQSALFVTVTVVSDRARSVPGFVDRSNWQSSDSISWESKTVLDC